jgi:hypothetical protein
MRAIFRRHLNKRSFEIHFTQELPLFPKNTRTLRFMEPKVLISRTVDVEEAAEASSRINVGKICLEIHEPCEVFRKFFLDLTVLDGFDLLENSDRYSFTIKVGYCFDPEPVCRSVAKCVQRHFYPEETLVCESQLAPSLPKKERKRLILRELPDDE